MYIKYLLYLYTLYISYIYTFILYTLNYIKKQTKGKATYECF